MQTQLWQLNPALSIQDFTEGQQLKFGQLSPHAFTVNENYNEVKIICLQLKSKTHFSYEDFVEVSVKNQFSFAGDDGKTCGTSTKAASALDPLSRRAWASL